jgi:2-keto-4-pentenoate hydratase/2-oxohepta-3-ene-1,7-dioic acid hydratase in catechol pathway
MTASVNGEQWSRGSTASMHHSFEDAVVMLSRDRQLHAGEIIASGTVLTGCGFELQRRLSPGDVVELYVEAIGTLTTTVRRAERRA